MKMGFFKNKKQIWILMVFLLLFGCGQKKEDPEFSIVIPEENKEESTEGQVSESQASEEEEYKKLDVNVGLTYDCSVIACAHIMDKSEKGDQTNENYKFTFYDTAEEVSNAFEKGDINAAVVSADRAACLYAKEKCVAVTPLATCNYHLVTYGEKGLTDITKIPEGLVSMVRGDELAEIIINEISDESEDISEPIKIEKIDSYKALVEGLKNGKVECAVIPEPYISLAIAEDENITSCIDLYDLWDELTGTKLYTSMLVAKLSVAEDEEDRIRIKSDFDNSVRMANARENLDQTAEIALSYMKEGDVAAFKASIPGCSLVRNTPKPFGEELTKLYTKLYDQDPQSIGGTIPAKDFCLS